MVDTPDDLRPAIRKYTLSTLVAFRAECAFSGNVLATVLESSVTADKKINALEALSTCL
jgi:hypothetical protein